MDSKKSKSAEGLTRGAVEELKKLHNPPQVVKEALRATMYLLGYGEAQANVSDVVYVGLFVWGRRPYS